MNGGRICRGVPFVKPGRRTCLAKLQEVEDGQPILLWLPTRSEYHDGKDGVVVLWALDRNEAAALCRLKGVEFRDCTRAALAKP